MEGEEQQAKKERFGVWFSAFARGPDTINASFWSPVVLALASYDSICTTRANGDSSGSDGQRCTPDSWWNDKIWRALNGTACETTDVFGTTQFEHLDTPACAEALRQYRDMSLIWVRQPELNINTTAAANAALAADADAAMTPETYTCK